MFFLEDNASELTMGRSFAELQALCERLVWIDTEAEAASFTKTLAETLEEQ